MGPMMMAEIMYAAYRTASRETNVRGQKLPEWHELEAENQKAWVTAVNAVRNPKLSDLGDQAFVESFGRLQLALGNPKLDVAPGETIEIALIDRAIEVLAAGGAKGNVAA